MTCSAEESLLRDPWVALGSPGCSMLEHPEGESGCRGGDAEMPRGRGNARRLRRLVWRDAPLHRSPNHEQDLVVSFAC